MVVDRELSGYGTYLSIQEEEAKSSKESSPVATANATPTCELPYPYQSTVPF